MLGRRRFNLLAGNVSGVYQQLRAGSRNGASCFIINRVESKLRLDPICRFLATRGLVRWRRQLPKLADIATVLHPFPSNLIDGAVALA